VLPLTNRTARRGNDRQMAYPSGLPVCPAKALPSFFTSFTAA
jgi:hypothetical protein